MKNINVFKSIAIALVATCAMPVLALAYNGIAPTFSILGISGITDNKAIVQVSYNSGDSDYVSGTNDPRIVVEYTNLQTGSTQTTDYTTEYQGARISNFWLNNLSPGTSYSYRALMAYNGMNIASDIKTFRTVGSNYNYNNGTQVYSNNGTYIPTIDYSVNNAVYGTTVSNTTYTNPLITATNNLGNTLSVSNITSKISEKVKTGGGIMRDGVGLSITDEQARVEYNDRVTFTVTYQNGRASSLKNAEISVQLPNEYEFVNSSADLDYNDATNTVTLNIGRISANTTKSFTFTARAVGAGTGDIKTTATIDYDGGSLSISDRDAYHGNGTSSVLGASIFGAGFFPQTFGGWIAIVILIALIVIVARRYSKAPTPVKVS